MIRLNWTNYDFGDSIVVVVAVVVATTVDVTVVDVVVVGTETNHVDPD